jgi:hypothetical protein
VLYEREEKKKKTALRMDRDRVMDMDTVTDPDAVTDTDTVTDTDADEDADADTDTDIKFKHFCLESIRRYSPVALFG